jgi:hypothetical protein
MTEEKIIPSIYIKHIFSEITEEEVKRVLEQTYNLGKIDKIYSRHKLSEKDGHEYYSCDIHFVSWSNDPNAIEMMNIFRNGQQTRTRLNYSGDKYWRLKLFHSRYHIRSKTSGSPSPFGFYSGAAAITGAPIGRVELKVYVIYHEKLENTNLFTTNENKIAEIIRQQEKKYQDTNGQWSWRTIEENVEFDADLRIRKTW